MITANVLQRTFFIRFDNSTGTCFAIDNDSKQYLATARHVVKGIRAHDVIHVFHDRQWKELAVQSVGIGEGESDITVLAPSQQLSPTYPLEATTDGLALGQQLYLLGFPFGWDGGAEDLSNGYPMPFVKSGVFSATFGNPTKIYLDAHGNKGFSGGPVVFVPNGGHISSGAKFRVAGIVSNYPTPRIEPVITADGEQVLDQNKHPIGIRENPGFVTAIGIRHAVDLINQNPIGFPLPVSHDGS